MEKTVKFLLCQKIQREGSLLQGEIFAVGFTSDFCSVFISDVRGKRSYCHQAFFHIFPHSGFINPKAGKAALPETIDTLGKQSCALEE